MQSLELEPQDEIQILKETMNNLLDERNYLVEELNAISDDYSEIKKVSLKQLVTHAQGSDIGASLGVSSRRSRKHEQNRDDGWNPSNKKWHDSRLKKQAVSEESEKVKFLNILQYWEERVSEKADRKKAELEELHEYYANKLKQQQQQQYSSCKGFGQQKESDGSGTKIKSREILALIKEKEQELDQHKSTIKDIKQLSSELGSLSESELYKAVMLKVLFGEFHRQSRPSTKSWAYSEGSRVKRELNYRQLKHFLLSGRGIIPTLTSLNLLVFGKEKVESSEIENLRQQIQGTCVLDFIDQMKSTNSDAQKLSRKFNKEKTHFMKKLQRETQYLCAEWEKLNEEKRAFEQEKGEQIRFNQKLSQEKDQQIEFRYRALEEKEKNKVLELRAEQQSYEEKISELQERQENLEERYERRHRELEQFETMFNSFKLQKESLLQMQQELSHVKKDIFHKQALASEINEKLKQLSLTEEINTERLKFLERKCYEKSEEIKALDAKVSEMTKRLQSGRLQQQEQQKVIISKQQEISSLLNQQQGLKKTVERTRHNFATFDEKLKNLLELESHKKKSLQELEVKHQEQQHAFTSLSERHRQLEQIIEIKEETLSSYKLKIAEHKKSLQTFEDINKSIVELMNRQSELKRSILELEIENGNLLDLKGQLVRDVKQYDGFGGPATQSNFRASLSKDIQRGIF